MEHHRETCKADATEILELLKQQVGLYGRLETLTRKQRTLIAEPDTRPLFKVLTERQRLTVLLQEVNERMGPFRRDWSRVRDSLNTGDRASADRMLDEANASLRGILESDEQDVRQLSLRKQCVTAELTRVDSAKRAMAAYGATSAQPAGCLDRVHGES